MRHSEADIITEYNSGRIFNKHITLFLLNAINALFQEHVEETRDNGLLVNARKSDNIQ